MSDKELQRNYSVKIKNALFSEGLNESEIDLDLRDATLRREEIKSDFLKKLQGVRDGDNLIGQTKGGESFLQAYANSAANAGILEFELNDVRMAIVAEKATQFAKTEQKKEKVKDWQHDHDKFRNFIDDENNLGHSLPPAHKRSLFWGDLWFSIQLYSRWSIFLLPNLFFLAPGKLRRRIARKRREVLEAQNAAAKIQQGQSAAEAEKISDGKKSVIIPLDAGSDAVLDALERAETEDIKPSTETPTEQIAQSDTQAEQTAAAPEQQTDMPRKSPKRTRISAEKAAARQSKGLTVGVTAPEDLDEMLDEIMEGSG